MIIMIRSNDMKIESVISVISSVIALLLLGLNIFPFDLAEVNKVFVSCKQSVLVEETRLFVS